MEQPPILNLKLVKTSDADSMLLNSDDIDNNSISSSNGWSFNKIILYLIVISSIDIYIGSSLIEWNEGKYCLRCIHGTLLLACTTIG